MKTLIVPAAGNSSRFPNMRPKWLLTHADGSLMIEKSIKPLLTHSFDRVIITIVRNHCKKNDADVILKQVFGDQIEIYVLENITSSASETVYLTIKNKNVTGHTCVKDTDCLVTFPQTEKINYIVGLEIEQHTNIHNLQAKSFIIANSDNIIDDIVEKELVSNVICTGFYSFLSEHFCDSYEKMMNNMTIDIKKELYVSHIMSDMMRNDPCIFELIHASDFKDCGTLQDWEREQSRFRTYLCDIDGVLLENVGKYGINNWSNHFHPIMENMECLKEKSDAGAEIIFVTSRTEEYLKDFKEFIAEYGIIYKIIISGCNHSQRVLLNDFAPTNPYPSCEAISVPRNSLIKEYIN